MSLGLEVQQGDDVLLLPSPRWENFIQGQPCDRTVFKMAEGVQQPLPKRHDLQTSADLERVTDYAEEKEISTTDIENVSSVHF